MPKYTSAALAAGKTADVMGRAKKVMGGTTKPIASRMEKMKKALGAARPNPNELRKEYFRTMEAKRRLGARPNAKGRYLKK